MRAWALVRCSLGFFYVGAKWGGRELFEKLLTCVPGPAAPRAELEEPMLPVAMEVTPPLPVLLPRHVLHFFVLLLAS